MQAELPHIVGIAGGSCAGKTWLANRLQDLLGRKAARLSLDDFYHDQSHLSPERRARVNFDRPAAIDWARLEKVLSNFAEGRAASVPRYNFVTHGRLADDTILQPAAILILEGLWLFRRASVRRMLGCKIYIRSTTELCAERRIQRDTMERGRTVEEVLGQLNRHTLPLFQRYVAPQEKWADMILEAPVSEREVARVAEKIESIHERFAVGI